MNLKRILINTILTLITLPCAAYLADLALWHLALANGKGMSTVHVSRIVVAPLKGGKEEYYPDGAADLDCSRSLFPQAGSGPCWWIDRHRVIYDR